MIYHREGNYCSYCQLGGTIWQLNSAAEDLLAQFMEKYPAFAVTEQPAHCQLFLTPGPVPGRYGDDHGVPLFKHEADKIRATHFGSYDGYYSLNEPVAYFNIAAPAFSTQRCATYSSSICNVIRLMVMLWLPHYQRLLLHSACLIFSGEAYLFLGHSGRGKSTLAGLFPENAVTGDVTLAGPAAENGGAYYIWPTFLDVLPGERRPEGYPLKKIYLLMGHKEYSLKEIASRLARTKALLENSVGIGWPKAEEMLALAGKLAAAREISEITYLLKGDGQQQRDRLKEIFLMGRL